MEEEKALKNAEKTQIGKPFEKGNPGGPGRPAGTRNYTTLLEEAIKDYENKTGKDLFERLIQRAFINDTVLLNVVKKFIPDKTQTEVKGLELPDIHVHYDED
jgi:hypothetical protein